MRLGLTYLHEPRSSKNLQKVSLRGRFAGLAVTPPFVDSVEQGTKLDQAPSPLPQERKPHGKGGPQEPQQVPPLEIAIP